MKYKKYDLYRGYIAFTSILVISAITLAVVISVSLLGVDELKSSLAYAKGNEALAAADSCFNEALIRLSRDNNYIGGALPVPNVQCSISISGTIPNYTIDITGKDATNQYVKRLRAVVRTAGTSVRIISYTEIP